MTLWLEVALGAGADSCGSTTPVNVDSTTSADALTNSCKIATWFKLTIVAICIQQSDGQKVEVLTRHITGLTAQPSKVPQKGHCTRMNA